MRYPVYYLIGTSGHPNYGDEFITAAWLRYLNETAPDAQVWLDCPQPGSAAALFQGLHPNLNVTNTMWRAVLESAHLPAGEIGGRVRGLVANLGSPAYDLGLLQLREAQSLHLIGGGYLNGVWPHHSALADGMRAVKELTGARLYATGQGLMPLPEGLADPTALFAEFDHISVRDNASSASFGVPLGIDDAFLGTNREMRRDTHGAEGLFVCIQSDMTDAETFHKTVAGARPVIEHAISQGKRVSYVEGIPGVDHAAFALLSDLIAGDRFIPFSHLWQHGLPLSSQQEWLTTRFHFHLLAAAAGARGVALGIKPGYYDVKHQSLIELGSGWTFVGADDIDSRLEIPTATGSLARRLPELEARKRAEADRLYPPVRQDRDPETGDRFAPAMGSTLLRRFGAVRARR